MEKNINWYNYLYKGIYVTTGTFFVGFFIYFSLYKRYKKSLDSKNDSFSSIILYNEISKSQMLRILKRIKRKILIFKANLHDLSKNYDSEEFINNLNENHQIIFDEDFIKECEEKNIKNIEEIENYKKIFINNIVNDVNMKQKCKKFLLTNYSQDIYLKTIKNTVLSFNYTYLDFKKSLDLLLSKNRVLYQEFADFEKLNISEMDENTFFGVVFQKELKKKYLLVIFNIYLVNLSKMQEIYISEYLSNSRDYTFHEALQILEEIYDKNLKSTVKRVINHFGITNNNISIDDKTYIQLYIHYLNPYNPQRIKAEKLISYYSEIINKIANKNKYSLLVFAEPVNEFIHFNKILSSIQPIFND